jgi:lipopolysaccharide export system permease protein
LKKIYLLILKNYLGPFAATFFISLFILLMQFLWKYIDDLVGKGLEWYIIAQLLFYTASTLVPLALPLAILLSSIMTFGNLGEHYEIVALKAAGISLRKIMNPLIITSVILSMAAFIFSNYVLPVANLKMDSLLYDVKEKRPALNIRPGYFNKDMENYTIRIGSKESDGKTIGDVMIYNHTNRIGNIDLTIANNGKMETTTDEKIMVFSLYDGCNYVEHTENNMEIATHPYQRTYFKENIINFDLSGFDLNRTNEELFKSNMQMMNLKQLVKAEDSLTLEFKNRKSNFADNLIKNYNYFKQYNSYDTIKTDTSKVLNADFLSNFNRQEKIGITEIAMNIARNIKENLGFTKDEFINKEKRINRHKIEWHRKFTLSFACLVLFFIGAPLGAIIRKGGFGMPVVMSILFFVAFHIISISGEKFAREGVLEPFQGMWLASVILLPIGIALTLKATTDSSIFDMTVYSKFFRKLFFIRNKK